MHRNRRALGPWRKVYEQVWVDERFDALTDRAKLLWLFLLTGPVTTALPGVVVAGRLQIAERLGWEPTDLDAAFSEIERGGMAVADWRKCLIVLPRAMRYNPPESPNVLIAWSRAFVMVPECDLKARVYVAIKDEVASLTESFMRVFVDHFEAPKSLRDPSPTLSPTLLDPSPDPSRDPSRDPFGNQEQEQKQEQKQEQDVLGGAGGERADARPVASRRSRSAKRSRQKPDDFLLSDDLLQFAAKQGLSEAEALAEWDKFADYEYRDAKSDWSACWRTWVRNAANWQRRGATPTAAPRFAAQVSQDLASQLRAKAMASLSSASDDVIEVESVEDLEPQARSNVLDLGLARKAGGAA